MDTRLIFRDPNIFRWGDEVQYVKRIIGFVFVSQEGSFGKSGEHYFKRSENRAAFGSREIWQSAFPRKTSKIKYIWSVPQTDTGSQLEKSKANEWLFPKELGKSAAVTSE